MCVLNAEIIPHLNALQQTKCATKSFEQILQLERQHFIPLELIYFRNAHLLRYTCGLGIKLSISCVSPFPNYIGVVLLVAGWRAGVSCRKNDESFHRGEVRHFFHPGDCSRRCVLHRFRAACFRTISMWRLHNGGHARYWRRAVRRRSRCPRTARSRAAPLVFAAGMFSGPNLKINNQNWCAMSFQPENVIGFWRTPVCLFKIDRYLLRQKQLNGSKNKQ
jgi:hypothetical protein